MQRASVSNSNNGQRAVRAPPALDPERVGLVQPFKDFVSKGWISELTFTITPSSTACKVTLSDDVKTDKVRKDIAPGVAKQIIVDAGLWTPGQRGAKNSTGKPGEQLPKRSLCKRDFEGNDTALKARIASVAKEIGDERARGRVGSLRLTVEGIDTFDAWWKKADPGSKIRLLADKKAVDSFTPEELLRFAKVAPDCPFRGAVPTPSEEEEEDQEPKKPGRKTLANRTKSG